MNLSDHHALPGFAVTMPVYDSPAEWLQTDANGWQLIASALISFQSVPGLIILYSSMVKKKWAVNSAFMALYAFAAVLLCWVLLVHRMSFGDPLCPLLGRAGMAISEKYLTKQSGNYLFPIATYVFFQFAFAAITVILLAGSLLGRMNFHAWMVFVPLWLTASYSVGAFTLWSGGGFLYQRGVLDFAGGYVIHLSSGVAGFTAAYWVGPRIPHDRHDFPPNNIIHMLFGAGLLWLGWSGFNGGAPNSPNIVASIAILNTHLCTATSLSIWLIFDMLFYHKSSVIGAVQGMITGLVCITPAAGLVEPWAAMLMGLLSGSLTWYTMMVLHRRIAFFQKVDDTLGAFHTHAVAGTLGGLLTGLLAHPQLTGMMYMDPQFHPGLFYSLRDGKLHHGLRQLGEQILGAGFIALWNVVITTLICLLIRRFMPLRMDDEDLKIGDDAVHGEEAYALWGDGEKARTYVRWSMSPVLPSFCRGPRGG